MLKKIILISAFLIVLSAVVYADDYHWECLSYGDELPLHDYTCHSSCCQLCVKDGYSRLFAYCSGKPMCSCGTSGSIDQDPPDITINLPTNDFYSGSRSVEFDLDIDEPNTLSYFDSEDERRGWRRICSGDSCMNYNRKISFKDGCHTVTWKAKDRNNNEGFAEVDFCVDSLKPKIKRTYPRKNEYINTIFTVEYDEELLDYITLHYKGESQTEWTDVPLQNCPSGKRQTCSIEINDLPEGPLEYYFTVADRATAKNSTITTVIVDTTAPELTVTNPQEGVYATRKVPFDILISEDVSLYYKDLEDLKPKLKKLCSKCDSYNRFVNFKDGYHRIIINATDNAGNYDTEQIEFFVDSKYPKIKRIEPRKGKYGNGNFTVQYQEDALVEVKLYYKQDGSTTYETASTTDCLSGKNEYCSIFVENLENGPLSYYFSLEDKATTIVYSKEYEIMIDTIIPEFTMNSPENGVEYYRRVPFDITLDEKVTLEYIDHESNRPRFRRLCSNCDSYIRERSFSIGNHDLTIRATDVAGNIYQEDVEFNII